jgi:hypothetical protein
LRPSKSHSCEDTAARPSAPTRRCVLSADLGEHEGYLDAERLRRGQGRRRPVGSATVSSKEGRSASWRCLRTTGWYDKGKRRGKNIRIHANGRPVLLLAKAGRGRVRPRARVPAAPTSSTPPRSCRTGWGSPGTTSASTLGRMHEHAVVTLGCTGARNKPFLRTAGLSPARDKRFKSVF